MEHIMPCEDWAERLACLHLEDLSEADQLAFHQHLQQCPNCARVYQEYNMLDDRIRTRNLALPALGPLPDILPLLQENERKELYNRNGYGINLCITAPADRTEVILSATDVVESVVESLISLILLDFFEKVIIDEVSVTYPTEHEIPVTMALRAQGIEPLRKADNLDILVEERITSALSELFGSFLQVGRSIVA